MDTDVQSTCWTVAVRAIVVLGGALLIGAYLFNSGAGGLGLH
jgi:hypothetical protein